MLKVPNHEPVQSERRGYTCEKISPLIQRNGCDGALLGHEQDGNRENPSQGDAQSNLSKALHGSCYQAPKQSLDSDDSIGLKDNLSTEVDPK